MPNTKVPIELSSTPGIIDNSTVTAITIDSAGAATFSGDVTSGAHLVNASSSAFGGSSIQGYNTDFLVDTGQGYTRHNSYHTGGSNHQFLVNETGSTTNAVAFSIAKDKMATFSGDVDVDGVFSVTDAGSAFVTRADGGGFSYTQGLDVATAGCSFTGASSRGDMAAIRLYQTATGVDGGYIRFDTASTGSTTPSEKMRIDASGRLVINGASYGQGTLLVKQKFDGPYGGLVVESLVNDHFLGLSHDSGSDCFVLSPTYNTTGAYKPFAIHTSNTERLRVDTSGNLLINCTSLPAGGIDAMAYQNTGDAALRLSSTGTGGSYQIRFFNANGEVGNIISDGSATAYNTSSDQRLKENIADADDAGSKIDAIKVRQYDWKADGSHQDYGMIAQELQTVAPEAVSGDADSEEMMGVDYSKLVPMLIKEIQSLRARINALETE